MASRADSPSQPPTSRRPMIDQRQEPGDDEEELQDLVVDRRGQAAHVGVDEHDARREQHRHREVPAQQQLQQLAHRVHRHAGGEHRHRGERDGVEAAGLLVEAQLQVLGHRSRARAVVERHHEDADEHHRRDGADPVEMRRRDAVLRAAGAHPDHFLGAEVGGDEGEAGDPGRNRPARQEEIGAGARLKLQQHADAEHEPEVDDDEQVVNPVKLHPERLRARRTIPGFGLHWLDNAGVTATLDPREHSSELIQFAGLNTSSKDART